jgi:hypothetical protein
LLVPGAWHLISVGYNLDRCFKVITLPIQMPLKTQKDNSFDKKTDADRQRLNPRRNWGERGLPRIRKSLQETNLRDSASTNG